MRRSHHIPRGAYIGLAGLLALLLSSSVTAKSWPPKDGVTPGETSRDEVIAKFGEPTRTFSKGGRLSDGINYQGEEAIAGSLEANFYFDKHGILSRIDVFPAREITREQVVKIYGKKFQERVTKTGHTFFNYWRVGMIVFFEKEEDKVLSFMFTQAQSKAGGQK